MTGQQGSVFNRVFTIPNLLSVLRLCMVPGILYAYLGRWDDWLAAGLLLLSGVTDILDGFIARHFHQISSVGRILDPVADKLTQLAVMGCLCVRFTYVLIPLIFLAIKELVNGVIALVMLKKNGSTMNSRWHGKASTVCLYVMMLMLILWPGIPSWVAYAMIGLCIALLGLSFTLYTLGNLRTIRQASQKELSE